MSKLAKNSAIYTAVSVLQKAIGFFLIPLYTAFLTPEDYGKVAVITTFVSLMSILYGLSLHGAVSRFYFKYKDSPEILRRQWGSCFLFTIAVTVVLSLPLIVFRKALVAPFLKGVDFWPDATLALVSIILNPLYLLFQSMLQAKQDGRRYGSNNFAYFLVNIGLTLLFVVVLRWKATGIIAAAAGTSFVFFIYTLIAFVPQIDLRIDRPLLKESLVYSLPLVPHALSGWVSTAIDRLFLNALRSTAEVGLYNIGFQMSNVLHIITTAVNQAYAPWFFEKVSEGEPGERSIRRVSLMLVALYSWMGLGISLFARDVIRIMVSSSFREGWWVIPFLVFGYVFNGLYYVVCNILFLRRTYLVPVVTFAGALISLVLNMMLIPAYGMMGSAFAFMASQAISSIIVLVLASVAEKMRFTWKAMYAYVFSALALALIPLLKPRWDGLAYLALRLVIAAGFGAFILYRYRDLVSFSILAGFARKLLRIKPRVDE